METPLVSVLLPSFNGARHIERSIQSVAKQTYSNTEIIVVDDGSTDNTFELVGQVSLRHPAVYCVRNEKNMGFVKSLNRALGLAKGKYIARIDDDDYWADDKKLEKQVRFLEQNPNYVLVGGGLIKIDATGKESIRYLFPQKDEDIRRTMLMSNPFAHSAVVFDKSSVDRVGGYDERFGFFADRDLWLKLGKVGKLYNFPEYFICYLDKEIGNGNYQARNNQIRRRLSANIRLREKYRNDYPGFWKSVCLCIASYMYSYVPFRALLWPLIFKLRILLFGQPAYRYRESNQKKG